MRLMTRPCGLTPRGATGPGSDLRLHDMRTRWSSVSIATTYDVILLEGAYGPQHLVNDFPFSGVVYLEESVAWRLWRRLRRDVRDRHVLRYVVRQMLRRCRLANASSSSP